ncbi:thioredoxin family protein [candidate division KSB1 bacterium]
MGSLNSKITIVVLSVVALLVIAAVSQNNPDKKADRYEKSPVKWMSFDEGFKKAAADKKLLVVDVYTDWCTYCKKMDSETFTDKKVADYMVEKYVSIKLNAEAKETINYSKKSFTPMEWAGSMGVTGYPTVIFFEPDGKPITALGGYAEAKDFYDVLVFIGSGDIKTGISFQDWRKNRGN